jgi:1-deoxy-D-xylulose-5-phosphate synthase
LDPRYLQVRERVRHLVEDLPGGVSSLAFTSFHGLSAAVREVVEPRMFFEAIGIRYTGPIDGHDIAILEQSLRRAASWNGPIVLHVVTTKGKGYAPAEADDVACLHDMKAVAPVPAPRPGRVTGRAGTQVTASTDDGGLPGPIDAGESYAEVFSSALVELAARDERIVAITAAMPGPTGLLAFEDHFPDRFVDVGIAEGHAMTAAAGMAMAGLRPVVAIYSTFLSRCFDQENLDVGLHRTPVVICADRAGITGDDGASHHGVLDMVLGLAVPGLVIFAPSEPAEIPVMLETALGLDKPSIIRYPKTPAHGTLGPVGEGLHSRVLREGAGDIVIVGIGKLAAASLEAASLLHEDGFDVTVIDPRLVRPLDPALVARCRNARLVVTAEDGLVHGGAGEHLRGVIERAAGLVNERPPTTLCLGVPTIYIGHANPEVILQRLELDASGIAASTRAASERLNRQVGNGSGVFAPEKGLGRRHRRLFLGGEGMVAR